MKELTIFNFSLTFTWVIKFNIEQLIQVKDQFNITSVI